MDIGALLPVKAGDQGEFFWWISYIKVLCYLVVLALNGLKMRWILKNT